MKKAACIVLMSICFFAVAYNRLFNAETRLAHADEAEQASVFLNLYNTGEYTYNPNGPHGPTLYYFADTLARLADQPPESEITINTLRQFMIPFGLGIIALYLIFSPFIGWKAAWGATAVFSLSTTASIYSTYFVHEIIFAFAILGLAQAIWHFVLRPSAAPVVEIGIFAALAQCTKETAVIAYPAIFIALVAVCAMDKSARKNILGAFEKISFAKYAAIFALSFGVVFVAFYSSFGANWQGVIDAFSSYGHFISKAGAEEHSSGFFYYFKLLTIQKCEGVRFGELPIFALSIVGFLLAIVDYARSTERLRALCAIFMFLSGFITVLFLSCISYKTPWLILSPIVLMCISAGYLIRRMLSVRSIPLWIFYFAILAAAAFAQYKLNTKAVVTYNSDPRNPFIYAHTVRDFENMTQRIRDISKVSEYGDDMPVAFVTKTSPWPAPWFLRDYPNAGFWRDSMPKNFDAFEIIVCDSFSNPEVAKCLDESLYVSEFYGIRKNLILTVYIKKNLFETLIKETENENN